MRKPRIIFFDIDGIEPDLDDYFAVAKSTVRCRPILTPWPLAPKTA